MKTAVTFDGQTFEADLSEPIDISLPLSDSPQNPVAWYLEKPSIEPVTSGDWVGKVSLGQSSTNFNNILFNPHGHGTHTECLGHITHDFYSVNTSLKQYFFVARLVSVAPEKHGGDDLITQARLSELLKGALPDAVVIRTLPNDAGKKTRKYSHTNPPYLSADAAAWLRENGVQHLLIDLPSVDREQDQGALLAHKAFWNLTNVDRVNEDARITATITELIFVPDEVPDGWYLLNLQTAPFENDATPSRPVLFKLKLSADVSG